MTSKYDTQGNYLCDNKSKNKTLTDKIVEGFARCSCVRDKTSECKVDIPIPIPIRYQQMSNENLAKFFNQLKT